MARRTHVSFATSNLYNINEPGLAIYNDTDGWSRDAYDRKVEWTAAQIKTLDADVWGFQELWHRHSLDKVFKTARQYSNYRMLVPRGHSGERIVCAGAVRKEMLVGEPEWIEDFPTKFRLESSGDDAQTPDISVNLASFSRPVLHFQVMPRSAGTPISVFVAHFKSKGPTRLYREGWYRQDSAFYGKHAEGLGAAISTIRRTAEAAALRMILTDLMKGTGQPVVVLGDLNDGQGSNTLNILTGQPNYLVGLSSGGSDVDLYSAGTLQEYRSRRDVYYTHVYNNSRESLDHILVSQEFYDNSRKRIWAFAGMQVVNDHLNVDDHKESGTADHGIVKATFGYRPAR